jgi:hypothetical protein
MVLQSTWGFVVMYFLGVGAKCLISNYFVLIPRFLWITLFISCSEARQSLVNQGFGWNAQKKSKVIYPYKSMTYVRYGVCSGCASKKRAVLPRYHIFVHK